MNVFKDYLGGKGEKNIAFKSGSLGSLKVDSSLPEEIDTTLKSISLPQAKKDNSCVNSFKKKENSALLLDFSRLFPKSIDESRLVKEEGGGEESKGRPLLEIYSQITTLFQMRHLKKTVIQRLSDFTFYIIDLAGKDEEKLEFYQEILGKFFYLISVDISLGEKLVPLSKNFDSSLQIIEREFAASLSLIKEKLECFKERHRKTGIQSFEQAMQTAIPYILAQLLITGVGTINYLLIPSLQKNFLHDIFSKKYAENYFYVLDCLWKSPQLCDQLAHLEAPTTPRAPTSIILKLSLSIQNLAPITNFNVQQMVLATALSALASHWRQRGSGSCFASSLTIGLLSSHLELCLKDFAQLIKSNKLSRTICHTVVDFPFLLTPNSSELHKKLFFTPEAKIVKKISEDSMENSGELFSEEDIEEEIEGKMEEAFIWEAPGIEKVCHFLAIESQEGVEAAIKILCCEKEEEGDSYGGVEATVGELLQQLVLYSKEKYSAENKDATVLFTQAALAYESQTCNLLVKAWESAIAGMTEGLDGGLIKQEIIKAVFKALIQCCREWKLEEGSVQIAYKLKEQLLDYIHLQYDLSMYLPPSTGREGVAGAFVLYDKIDNERIDNPLSFANFIQKALIAVAESLPLSPSQKNSLEKLLHYTKQRNFIINTLCAYCPESILEADPIREYKKMHYAPWVNFSGNLSKVALQVYFEEKSTKEIEKFMPANGLDLLKKIFLLKKKLVDRIEREEIKYIPVSTLGVHAFSLLLSHPSFSLEEKMNFNEWVEQKLLTAGRTVSEALLPLENLEKIIKYVKKYLLTPNKELLLDNYLAKIPQELSVKEWRSILAAFLESNEPCDAFAHRQRVCSLDTAFYRALPLRLKQLLEASAVQFADTNWQYGNFDLHFCFVVNPATGEVEMWEAYDDGSHLQAIDQQQWIVKKTWEFYSPYSCPSPKR